MSLYEAGVHRFVPRLPRQRHFLGEQFLRSGLQEVRHVLPGWDRQYQRDRTPSTQAGLNSRAPGDPIAVSPAASAVQVSDSPSQTRTLSG